MLDSGKYEYGNSRVSVSLESTVQSGKWIVEMQIEGIIGTRLWGVSGEWHTSLCLRQSGNNAQRQKRQMGALGLCVHHIFPFSPLSESTSGLYGWKHRLRRQPLFSIPQLAVWPLENDLREMPTSSQPQFLHVHNGDNNSTYLIRLVW